jgi:hypothetical protein
VTDAAEPRRIVRSAKDAGPDLVKTYSSLSLEAYFAVDEESATSGLRSLRLGCSVL